MTKDDKVSEIEFLKNKFENANFFYVADSAGLTVAEVNDLRRKCFENEIEMRVAKNTLIKKALETVGSDGQYVDLYDTLKGPTSIFFCDVANKPAKVIKDFRGKDGEKPFVKGAYIDSAIYLGDESLNELSTIKSKEELLGEIIGLLQSPAKNVISALKSGGSTIAGLVKALEERAQ